MTDMKRILLVRTDRLGETLLNVPLAAALKNAYPGAHLTWLVHPGLVELLQDAPGVDRVIGDSQALAPEWRRALQLGRRLRPGHFDLALISNATKTLHAASWLARIPVRVGYDRKWGCLLTHRLEDRRRLGECHEVEYNMRLLAALGLTPPAPVVLRLPITTHGESGCLQLFERWHVGIHDQVVAVHPWTANPRKQWPLERMRRVLEGMSGRPGVRVIVVGGMEEMRQVPALMQGLREDVVNAVGRLPLPLLAACLSKARVVLTNDSGPMHLAAAVGAPVVALFGTGDPGSTPQRWGPWGAGHTVICKPLGQISADEVLSAIRRYLP